MAGRTEIKRNKDGNIIEIVHSDYIDGYEPDSLFNFNVKAGKFMEALLQNQFYAVIRDNAAGTKYHFYKVKGTKLTDDLFAFKDAEHVYGWSVTDKLSGLALKTGFPTLKACKEYVANFTEEDWAKINEQRKKPRYLNLCKELADFILAENNELNQDFPDPED